MNRLILVAILLWAPAWSLAQESKEEPQPSLAELARRERARRASSGSTTPIITNATIKGMKGLVSTSGAPASEIAEGEAEGEGEESAESGETGPSQEELSGKFAEARLNLKNAVNRNMVVQLEMNELRNSYFRESDGARKARIQKDLQQLQNDIQASRQEVQRAREAIQALEGEAREAGISPEDIRTMVGDLPQEESITGSPQE